MKVHLLGIHFVPLYLFSLSFDFVNWKQWDLVESVATPLFRHLNAFDVIITFPLNQMCYQSSQLFLTASIKLLK